MSHPVLLQVFTNGLRSADTEVTDVTTEALEEDMERIVGDFQLGCLKFV